MAASRAGRWLRLALLAVVAIGLAPVTWLQSSRPLESDDERALLTITAVPVANRTLGELRVAGAWHLTSRNRHFGSYSALAPLGGGILLAVSDRGRRLRFTPPGRTGPRPQFGFLAEGLPDDKRLSDAEALARDPGTGRLWVAYEGSNQIERLDEGLRPEARVRPAAMRGWPSNGGPEAMVRLGDGRFVVLAESSRRWRATEQPGLLFEEDPTMGGDPLAFRFPLVDGYRPSDMATLPDGRVLILLRKVVWGIPPRFRARLMLADPATIRAGEPWRGEILAELPEPLDNYEGLAVERDGTGGLVLWLIADDNGMRIQRTLLLKLLWPGFAEARSSSRRR